MVRNADECGELVVLIAGSLRRSESHTVSKTKEQELTYEIGERILASFTYNQCSRLAPGITAPANYAFDKSGTDTHKVWS